MLKSACNMTGENYTLLITDTPASKKKVVAMALAMLIPVTIWVFNGFMLALTVLKTGILVALLTALVCGIIVFLVEKLIIMARGNFWLSLFRVSIGFVVAVLGSIAIDEVVFNNDINTAVAEIKNDFIKDAKIRAVTQFDTLNRYNTITENIAVAQRKYDESVEAVKKEADGSYGTGKQGVGKITRLKQEIANTRKSELAGLINIKTQLDAEKKQAEEVAGLSAEKDFNPHSLLIRIKALMKLVTEDIYMLITYILFTLLMIFFEFLVVILKATWKKTNYEKRVEMIEQIGEQRIAFLMSRNSPVLDPGQYLKKFEMARNAVSRKNSLYK